MDTLYCLCRKCSHETFPIMSLFKWTSNKENRRFSKFRKHILKNTKMLVKIGLAFLTTTTCLMNIFVAELVRLSSHLLQMRTSNHTYQSKEIRSISLSRQRERREECMLAVEKYLKLLYHGEPSPPSSPGRHPSAQKLCFHTHPSNLRSSTFPRHDADLLWAALPSFVRCVCRPLPCSSTSAQSSNPWRARRKRVGERTLLVGFL